MNFYISLGLATATVLVIIGAVMWRRRRKAELLRRQARTAKIEALKDAISDWAASIMSATTARQVVEIGDKQILKTLDILDWWDLQNGFKTEQQKQARKRLEQARVARRFEKADDAEKLDMLFDFLIHDLVIPKQFGITKDFIVAQINQRVEAAEAEVASGERDAVVRFNAFRRTRSWSRVKFLGVKEPVCPEDWNELVTRHYKTPSITDFDGVRADPPYGIVSLLAAKALNEGNPVHGKIVIAYCALTDRQYYGRGYVTRHPYREEIGDELYADVAKMVHDFHVAEKLFPRPTQS